MTTLQIVKCERVSALCGALAWAILAGLAGFRKAPLGVIELLFLFAPLVIVPLGLSLGRMVSPLQNQRVETLLCLLQPVAAASTILSFWFSLGWVAGILAAPWLLFCGVIALAGAWTLLREKNKTLITWAVNIGRIDLAIAGCWLMISRLGLHPPGIQEPIVLLTAVHFHYTGFATTLLAGSLLTLARRDGSDRMILKAIVALVVATPFVVAVGFVWSPTLKMAAAIVLSASLAAFAGLQFWFAGDLSSRVARTYIRLSALSVVVAMALAATYAIGDWIKQDWLLIPRMASTHGLLNGLGFSLLAVLGWLVEFANLRVQKSASS
jgi:hypothetical protein